MFRRTIHLLVALSAFCAASVARADVVTYNPSLGTLPQAQGFTFLEDGDASPAPTVTGGVLSQGLTANNGEQYWQRADAPFNFDNGFVLEGTLKVTSSTYGLNNTGGQRSGYYFSATDTLGRHFQLGIAGSGITLNTDSNNAPANGIPLTAFNPTTGFHQYRLSVLQGQGAVYIDNVLIGSAPVGQALFPTSTNQVWFGDGTLAGDSQTQLSAFQYTTNAAPEPSGLIATGLPMLGVFGLLLTARRRTRKH